MIVSLRSRDYRKEFLPGSRGLTMAFQYLLFHAFITCMLIKADEAALLSPLLSYSPLPSSTIIIVLATS